METSPIYTSSDLKGKTATVAGMTREAAYFLLRVVSGPFVLAGWGLDPV
jgi:hypothetical protein